MYMLLSLFLRISYVLLLPDVNVDMMFASTKRLNLEIKLLYLWALVMKPGGNKGLRQCRTISGMFHYTTTTNTDNAVAEGRPMRHNTS